MRNAVGAYLARTVDLVMRAGSTWVVRAMAQACRSRWATAKAVWTQRWRCSADCWCTTDLTMAVISQPAPPVSNSRSRPAVVACCQ